MPKLNLSLLEPYFQKGKDFEITEEQYEENVKKKLPESKYLVKKSPVAKKAQEAGYTVKIEERIHRVLIFTKTEE